MIAGIGDGAPGSTGAVHGQLRSERTPSPSDSSDESQQQHAAAVVPQHDSASDDADATSGAATTDQSATRSVKTRGIIVP